MSFKKYIMYSLYLGVGQRPILAGGTERGERKASCHLKKLHATYEGRVNFRVVSPSVLKANSES